MHDEHVVYEHGEHVVYEHTTSNLTLSDRLHHLIFVLHFKAFILGTQEINFNSLDL